ncbi:structural maintenance of chromosomes protein 3-like [Nicotiana tomentosiformis]|uniref:structural maintenance of chromosomes protein 3-like n=1 Tax=Nicotiana tomentosiformis TaxID=4098 RepID=UPI00388C730C
MAAPPNFEEGQSTYRPPRLNGQYYGWWKTRIHDFIMAEDAELWDVICDGPFVPIKTIGELAVTVPKTRKEIWEALLTAHEGTTQVKQSKINMLTTEYELFRMKDDESIQDMHTRFISIINELHSVGEIIQRNKLIRKIFSVLPGSWESKVNAITEAHDLQKLAIDELIGNLKTYEMKKKKDHKRREPKKEKNLVVKADNNDSSGEDDDMAYLTKRFQKMVRINGGIPKRGCSSRPKGYDLFHKCGKLGHFIKDCPLHKKDQYKHNTAKTAKRNPVPDRRFKRKDVADNVMKQTLTAWGDSFGESREDDKQDDDDDELSFLEVQRHLKSYSQKKIISLANVLIDTYHNLISDKNMLTIELGEVEHERDDLVVVMVDLKKTIEDLKKENDALTEKIENVEHERDDLLVEVMNLKETIEELKRENSSGSTQKGKEVASEAHLKLENELKMGAMKGRNQRWYMDSGCSKHMTGSTDDFLSLKALQGGSVSFSNGKKGYILGVRRVGETLTASIENMYYVNGLKYILLSVSQICDKGNKVEFLSKTCTVTNFVTGDMVLMANGKVDLMIQVMESNKEDAAESLADTEEPGSSITTIEAVNKVVDVMQGTPNVELRSGTHSSIDSNNGSHSMEPRYSHNDIQVSNWKHKSSHPLQNVITPLDLVI